MKNQIIKLTVNSCFFHVASHYLLEKQNVNVEATRAHVFVDNDDHKCNRIRSALSHQMVSVCKDPGVSAQMPCGCTMGWTLQMSAQVSGAARDAGSSQREVEVSRGVLEQGQR